MDSRYTGYLESELRLLQSIPTVLTGFFRQLEVSKCPSEEHWLRFGHRYLLAAIKTTFQPTEQERTDWSYSNRMIPGEGVPRYSVERAWHPEPFFFHSMVEMPLRMVTATETGRNLLRGAYLGGSSPTSVEPGMHVIVIDRGGLMSFDFCESLQRLLARDSVTVLPLFLEEGLLAPSSEVPLLKEWSLRALQCPSGSTRERLDCMLIGFGCMIEKMRDLTVLDADLVLGLRDGPELRSSTQ